MINSSFNIRLWYISVSVGILIIGNILTATVSCKKDPITHDDNNTGIPGSTPVAHVLKEPYLLYTNDPTTMGVAVHTSHEVNGSDGKKVQIQWKYTSETDYHGYFDMDYYKFTIPYEYNEDHEDYYVWIKQYPHGHFNPGSKIDYEVKVIYNTLGDTKRYTGWFYTNDPDASTLTFYAISDTQEDGEEHDCNNKAVQEVGGGPEYFVKVMNSLAEDMSEDYINNYKLLLHCGDFVFNGPREYYYPQDNAWNQQFFGTTANNCCNYDRSKVLWILAHVPVMGSIGNHDWNWNLHSERNSIRDYVAAFPYDMYWERDNNISLENACDHDWSYKQDPKQLYYSFDYGPAHFISLSSFPADGDDQSTHFTHSSDQVSWLHTDLAKNTKEWIFVFTHIPIVHGHGVLNQPVYNTCESLFQLYGVDAVLQGHEHFYSRTIWNGITYLVLGGGGGFLMQYEQPLSKVFNSRTWFWSRFEILDSDSCRIHVECAYDYDTDATSGSIDDFTIPNRKRK